MPSPITTATSSNATRTITVRATAQGLPVAVTVDRTEYQYGARAIAAEVLRLTQRSAIAAAAKLREHHQAAGMPDSALAHLDLPTRAEAIAALDAIDDADTNPVRWGRPL